MANVIKIKRGTAVPTTNAQLAPGEIGFNTTDDSLYMNKGTDTTPDIVRVGEDASSHTHSYLPLSGGTLTGNLEVEGDMYVSGDIFNESVPVTQIKNVSVPASVEAYGVHSSTVRIDHYLGYVPKIVVITKMTSMGTGIQASLFALNSSYVDVIFSRYSSFGAHEQTLALQFYGTGGTVIV